MNRLTHDQFCDLFTGDYDLIDCQEEFSTQLFETGRVMFIGPDRKSYLLHLVVYEVVC